MMKPARDSRSAFTLIEIMMVVAIMAVAMVMAFPAISSALHRAPLTQGVMDVTEGCRKARAMAILQDHPMEMLIFSDGRISVGSAQSDGDVATAPAPTPSNPRLAAAAAEIEQPKPAQAGGFSGQLPDTVGVELIDVNFIDYMGADVARVHFYPNGTSDEFTIILKKDNDRRKITLEVVTGLAQVTAL